MKTENIDLYAYFGLKKPQGAVGTLTTYIHEQSCEFCVGRRRPAMLVIAGGGYAFVSDREKEPIAVKYFSEGFNTFAIGYSVSPLKFPTQLIETAMAMIYIRENADKYNILSDKVAAIGFSAGGHLLGTLSTMYDCDEVRAVLKDKVNIIKPDAAIFSYAVITSGDKRHDGSIKNLCGDDEKLWARVSIENNVNYATPPAFIWATVNDDLVPSENSLLLAMAYKNAGVPFELHLFSDGVHGLSLANKETANAAGESYLVNKDVASWFDLSVKWLNKFGFTLKF